MKGYIAITSLLIIMSVVLVGGIAISYTSLNNLQSSFYAELSETSSSRVDACIELALIELNKNNNIPTTITTPEFSCTINIDSNIAQTWTFTVTHTVNGHTKKKQVTATRSTTIENIIWKEI